MLGRRRSERSEKGREDENLLNLRFKVKWYVSYPLNKRYLFNDHNSYNKGRLNNELDKPMRVTV